MTLDQLAMERRLFALETKRSQLEHEIAELRNALRGAGQLRRVETLAPTGTFGSAPPPRPRTLTQPYVVADPPSDVWEEPSMPPPAPAVLSEAASLVPAIGLPEMPTSQDLAEPLADFDPGALRSISDAELDALPYGLVVVDGEGDVLRYNDTESRMVGLPAERVEGRNFFRDIAPCTRVRSFEGRFREFAKTARSYSVETFDFVFRFARETQHVTIYLTPGRKRGTFNIAMLRRKVEKR